MDDLGRRLFATALFGVLWGCEGESTAPPEAAESPTPPPAVVAQPEPACDPANLHTFECGAAERCSAVDVGDETIDLVEFLCLARARAGEGDGTLGRVLAATPTSFRKNFTAKHGLPYPGARGHAYETLTDFLPEAIVDNGQSATPLSPRTIVWDETTGFTVSFNGNAPGQTGGTRLDLLAFDPRTNAFELWALALPATVPLQPEQPHTATDDCTLCHGPHARPIWPMYPDWPGFYGSDNDSLSIGTPVAQEERALWGDFRRCVLQGDGECPAAGFRDPQRRFAGLFAETLEAGLRGAWPTTSAEAIASYVRDNPRNVPPETTAGLFDDPERTKDWLGLRIHPTFPYRPDDATRTATPSRAFFHRPNLRLGVLYNRLLVRAVMAELRRDPLFAEYEAFIALSVMDCGWEGDTALQAEVQGRFGAAVAERLAAGGLSIDGTTDVREPLLLTALGSSVREVDLRFSHSNPAYDPFDATANTPLAEGPMDVGFIAYRPGDLHAVAGSATYFNSYFDGTATFDELWAARMLDDLAAKDPALAAVYQPHTLTSKYERFTPRMALDAAFFERMDALGSWMPLPYPRHLRELHDREPFYKRKDGRARFIEPYLAVCRELRRGLKGGQASP